MKDTTETIIDTIKSIYDSNRTMTQQESEDLASLVDSDEKLYALLPVLRDLATQYKETADRAKARAKDFGDNRKLNESYLDTLSDILCKILVNLGHSKYTAGNAKVSLTTREVLECDDDSLINAFFTPALRLQLMTSLPAWIKVSVTVDKTALKNSLKSDNTLMVEHPEWLHTKENRSVTLK